MNQRKEILVFLVDDDQLFLEAMKHFLLDQKYLNLVVKTFTTGEKCLESLNESPDIIVLDYYLNTSVPNAMNGIDVLKKIKAAMPTTRVIMLSAQDNIEVAMETMKHGAFDYVSKSESSLVKVKNIISNFANTHRTTEELSRKLSFYKKINIIIIIIIIILFIISRLI